MEPSHHALCLPLGRRDSSLLPPPAASSYFFGESQNGTSHQAKGPAQPQQGRCPLGDLAEEFYMLKVHIYERNIHTSTCNQHKAYNTGIPPQGAAICGATCSGISPSCLHIVSIQVHLANLGKRSVTERACPATWQWYKEVGWA